MEQEYPNKLRKLELGGRDGADRQTMWGQLHGMVRLRYRAHVELDALITSHLRQYRVVDHDDYWTDGEYVLIVLEPYDVDDVILEHVVKAANKQGWNVDTTHRDHSVWNPGRTQMLIIWRPIQVAWIPHEEHTLETFLDAVSGHASNND